MVINGFPNVMMVVKQDKKKSWKRYKHLVNINLCLTFKSRFWILIFVLVCFLTSNLLFVSHSLFWFALIILPPVWETGGCWSPRPLWTNSLSVPLLSSLHYFTIKYFHILLKVLRLHPGGILQTVVGWNPWWYSLGEIGVLVQSWITSWCVLATTRVSGPACLVVPEGQLGEEWWCVGRGHQGSLIV